MEKRLGPPETKQGLKEIQNAEVYESTMWPLADNVKRLKELAKDLDTTGESARVIGPVTGYRQFLTTLAAIEEITKESMKLIVPVMVDRGLSVQDAADDLGKNRQTVTRWRADYRREMIEYFDDNDELMDAQDHDD